VSTPTTSARSRCRHRRRRSADAARDGASRGIQESTVPAVLGGSAAGRAPRTDDFSRELGQPAPTPTVPKQHVTDEPGRDDDEPHQLSEGAGAVRDEGDAIAEKIPRREPRDGPGGDTGEVVEDEAHTPASEDPRKRRQNRRQTG